MQDYHEEWGSGVILTQGFSVNEKYLMLHVYTIQNKRLNCYRHRGC